MNKYNNSGGTCLKQVNLLRNHYLNLGVQVVAQSTRSQIALGLTNLVLFTR
ncbi:MAG: hypothetical protein RM338_17300 [Nostoc sp. DedQUE12a]|nr:hypothetical protein [Nostoc sp. DedQUE12a]